VVANDATNIFFARKFSEAGIESLDDLRKIFVEADQAEMSVEAKREARLKKLREYMEKDQFRERVAHGETMSSVRALDPTSGELRWEFPLPGRSTSGVLTTAGDLLFVGSALGDFWALDAFSGDVVWHGNIEGWIHSAPVAYMSRGTQFISIASSKGLHAFALAE
jgi:outer membrane protein assembly factor BamB